MKVIRCLGLTLMLLSILSIVVPVAVYDVSNSPSYSSNQSDNEKPISNLANASGSTLATEKSLLSDSSAPKWNMTPWSGWENKVRIDGDFVEIVIGLDSSKQNRDKLLGIIAERGGRVKSSVAMRSREEEAVVAKIPIKEAFNFVSQASQMARYIEPNLRFQSTYVPNDPSWSLQWGPAKIEADYAWNTTRGEKSILVAVIDTGIAWNHPDLAANYAALGYDWVNDDADPMDDHGHGTHVAGIIGAVINNSIGIAGLAQVKIMAEKALDFSGNGYEDDLANAIIHAVDSGARILSNSWGGDDSRLIHDAMKYAYDNGVLIIAAAGNTASSQKIYPAAYPEVVAVTATDQSDRRAAFSTFGDWVELAAPGVDIYSTLLEGTYGYKSGTSMSTPHVSGVGALLWSRFPNMTRDQVRLHLRNTSNDLGDVGFDAYYGYGRINARKTVETSLPEHELMVFDWTTPPYVEPMSVGFVNSTVFNYGNSTEINITVQLWVDDTLVDSASIGLLESGAKAVATLSWSPTSIGKYNLTSYIVPMQEEISLENNGVSTYVYVGFPLKTFVLDSAGTDYDTSIWQELNFNWDRLGSKMIYVDYTVLNKENITYSDIASTKADVLILSNPFAWEYTDSEIEAITRYVLEGHGLIATAGLFHFMALNNNKLAPLFGLNETLTWDVAFTDLLHLQNATHPLFVDIPDPFVMRDVGGTVPADGRWTTNELAGGTYVALGHFQESAILVNKGLVYISPWLEVVPSYYQFHLQLFYNAIVWSRYQRPEHELSVALSAPPALNPSRSVMLNATVWNAGLSNETSVELQLMINGSVVTSQLIPQLSNGSEYTLGYLWSPTVEGSYNVSAYAVPVVDEDNPLNNKKDANVLVYQVIFALFKNVDPWTFKADEDVLKAVGVPYLVFSSKMFGIIDLRVFSKMVIASDQDQNFYNDVDRFRWWFEGYVNSGGMLEIHAADAGFNGGRWARSFIGGLSWTRLFSDFVTIADSLHPLINTPNAINDTELDDWGWTSHGYFQNYPNTTNVIIREDSYDYPVFIEFRLGEGVILATSLTLEWAYGKGYSRILENSLAYRKPQHELAVVLEALTYVRLGESKLLNVTLYNRGLNTETNVELSLFINGTLTNSTIIPELLGDTSLMLSYLWTPVTAGKYNVTASAPPVLDESNVENNASTIFTVVSSEKPGDANGDGIVNYLDVFILLKAYGSVEGDLNYNPNADFNKDGKVDYEDAFILLINYLK